MIWSCDWNQIINQVDGGKKAMVECVVVEMLKCPQEGSIGINLNDWQRVNQGTRRQLVPPSYGRLVLWTRIGLINYHHDSNFIVKFGFCVGTYWKLSHDAPSNWSVLTFKISCCSQFKHQTPKQICFCITSKNDLQCLRN